MYGHMHWCFPCFLNRLDREQGHACFCTREPERYNFYSNRSTPMWCADCDFGCIVWWDSGLCAMERINVHEGTTRKQTSNDMVRIREGTNWWAPRDSLSFLLHLLLLVHVDCARHICFSKDRKVGRLKLEKAILRQAKSIATDWLELYSDLVLMCIYWIGVIYVIAVGWNEVARSYIMCPYSYLWKQMK